MVVTSRITVKNGLNRTLDVSWNSDALNVGRRYKTEIFLNASIPSVITNSA